MNHDLGAQPAVGGNSLEHAALGGTVGVAAILVSSLLRLAVAGIARNDPAAPPARF